MDKKCNNIPELLCKKMTGTITQEEMEVLQQWADQNEANKQAYEQFTDVRFLEKQLNTALEVDTHQPRMEMEERIKASALQNTNNIRPAHTIGRTLFKYAAAIALLLVGGAMACFAVGLECGIVRDAIYRLDFSRYVRCSSAACQSCAGYLYGYLAGGGFAHFHR